MIPVPSGVRVWLATGHTDMRKGIASLSLQVQEVLRRDPLSGQLFCLFDQRNGSMDLAALSPRVMPLAPMYARAVPGPNWSRPPVAERLRSGRHATNGEDDDASVSAPSGRRDMNGRRHCRYPLAPGPLAVGRTGTRELRAVPVGWVPTVSKFRYFHADNRTYLVGSST
jgi:transposase